MYELVAPYTLEKIDSSGGKKYLLTINERPYYVGELVYLIISLISEKKSSEEILASLNNWTDNKYQFTKDKLHAIVEQHIRPLGIFDQPAKNDKTKLPLSGIQGQWTLVKFEHIKFLLEILKFAFQPVVFIVLFIGSLLINYFYISQLLNPATTGTVAAAATAEAGGCLRTANYVLLFYPLAFLVLFFHELGHTAASYMFGVKPKNIGFGFYLALPVLYADITGAWKLNRWKRTIVNLGGIYFQLLINTIIFFLLYEITNVTLREALLYIIALNVGTIFINLNPFFRFDGYWIYSDLFDLPNLRMQSNVYFIKAAKFLFPKAPFKVNENIQKITNLKNPFLLVYSIAKYIFYVYIIKFIIFLIGSSVINIGKMASQMYLLDFSVCALEFYAKTLFTVGVIGYFSYKYTKIFRSRARNYN